MFFAVAALTTFYRYYCSSVLMVLKGTTRWRDLIKVTYFINLYFFLKEETSGNISYAKRIT